MDDAVVPSAVQEQKLERLISLYADVVLRICFVYLVDKTQAQDAMQDTFIKAWRYLVRPGAPAVDDEKSWLTRIAINVCHDYYRSKWFRHIDAARSIDDLPARYVSVLPEDHSLLVDVCSLPEKYKQVLLLYYYQDMTLQEIADALHTGCSTVHKRLHKAQQLLKGRLTGRDIDAGK